MYFPWHSQAINRRNKGHRITAFHTEILFPVKDLNQQCRTKYFRASMGLRRSSHHGFCLVATKGILTPSNHVRMSPGKIGGQVSILARSYVYSEPCQKILSRGTPETVAHCPSHRVANKSHKFQGRKWKTKCKQSRKKKFWSQVSMSSQ